MRNKNRLTALIALSMIALQFNACKKDEDLPEIPQPVINEPENITTVELHFTSADGVSHIHAHWSDPDGPGGNAPMIDTIVLAAGTTYSVETSFLDESGTTSNDLTGEILEEDDEHIICFESDLISSGKLAVSRTDSDGSFEVGLISQWITEGASNGTIQIILKHQPDGVKDGSCTTGDTDVEVNFPIIIQ